jgi:hypothetical protein
MLFHNKLCTIASEQNYNKPITSGTCFLSTAAFANSATLLSDLCSRSTVGEKLFEHSKQESNYLSFVSSDKELNASLMVILFQLTNIQYMTS